MFSVILPLQCEHAENAEDDECSILAEPAASARSNNSDGREHSQFLHTATVLGLRMESVGYGVCELIDELSSCDSHLYGVDWNVVFSHPPPVFGAKH